MEKRAIREAEPADPSGQLLAGFEMNGTTMPTGIMLAYRGQVGQCEGEVRALLGGNSTASFPPVWRSRSVRFQPRVARSGWRENIFLY